MRRKKKFNYEKRKETSPPETNLVGTVLWAFVLFMLALASVAMIVESFN